MVDFRGNELKVGDIVAYYNRTSTSGGYMTEGRIIGFCKRGVYECAELVPNKGTTDMWWYHTVLSSTKLIKL